MEKKTSDRAADFKKKNNGIDRRNMRAHRRSIEWKQMRDQTVNLKRDLGSPLSPLRESSQNITTPKPQKTGQRKLTAAETRREKLEKWKQQKELKRKIELKDNAKKKPFKVAHIEPEMIPFKKNAQPGKVVKSQPTHTAKIDIRPVPHAKDNRVTTKTKPFPDTKTKRTVGKNHVTSPKKTETRRVTRSQATTTKVASKKSNTATSGKTVSKSGTKNMGRATKADNSKPAAKVATNKSAPTKQQPKSETRVNELKKNKLMDSVTKTRGSRMSSNDYSFAPADFKFTAPSRLQSYAFQPLSPGSAASFLFPSKDLSVFSPPSSRRCSTPKLVSNNPDKIRQSPQASAIQELTSGSSDSDTEKARTVQGKSPVLSLVKPVSAAAGQPTSTAVKDTIEDATEIEMQSESLMKSANSSRRKSTRALHAEVEAKELPEANASKEKSTVIADNEENMTEKDCENVLPTEAKDSKSLKNRKSISKPADPLPEQKQSAKSKTESLPEELLCGVRHGIDNSENVPPPADSVFRTPSYTAPRSHRNRTRSLGTALLLHNSAKKFKTPKNNRNSLILRTLSPEEGIEVLKHSPMIELTRRTPKCLNRTAESDPPIDPLPTFDDIEEELKLAVLTTSQENMDTSHNKTNSENTKVTSDQEMETVKPTENSNATSSTENASTTPGTEEKHDVPYFRKLLVIETDHLNTLCIKWEEINANTQDLSEEARGSVRTAIGKAHLLVAQRFKQFLGLVDDCEYKRGEKITTCQDLQGFWDMIFFQVEDVYNMFKDLDKRKEKNWEEIKPVVEKKKVIKKKPVGNKTAKPAAKSKFAAFRAKMKQQQEPVAESGELKTFEGGFFHVNSPVKSVISPHCEGGTPSRLRINPLLRHKTTCGSPLLKAAVERAARKSIGPSPLIRDLPSVMPQASDFKPETASGSKRKRNPTGSSGTPAKLAKLEENPVSVDSTSLFTPEAVTSSRRRSLRRSIRKSVSWNPSEVNPNESVSTVKDQTTNLSFSKFLVPTEAEEPEPQCDMEVDPLLSPQDDIDMATASKRALHSEFDKHSNSARKKSAMKRKSIATPSSIRRLSSESKSASGRRRSRRSVHFSCSSKSPPSAEKSLKMPVTPFNRDSLVPRIRRSSQNQSLHSDIDCSLFTPPTKAQSGNVDSPATRMSKLNMDGTPQDTPSERRRSTRNRRISGFTPPPRNSSPAAKLPSLKEDQSTALLDLMSFSPLPNNSSNNSTSTTPRRSRRSTRQSLL